MIYIMLWLNNIECQRFFEGPFGYTVALHGKSQYGEIKHRPCCDVYFAALCQKTILLFYAKSLILFPHPLQWYNVTGWGEQAWKQMCTKSERSFNALTLCVPWIALIKTRQGYKPVFAFIAFGFTLTKQECWRSCSETVAFLAKSCF